MLKGTAALPSSLRGAVHQIGVLSSKVTHLQRSRRAAFVCAAATHGGPDERWKLSPPRKVTVFLFLSRLRDDLWSFPPN